MWIFCVTAGQIYKLQNIGASKTKLRTGFLIHSRGIARRAKIRKGKN